jgi:short-subunit dehydrogenase
MTGEAASSRGIALVTGASSGIGEAMVACLARDGVACVVVARRRERLDELAAAHPGMVRVLAADLTVDTGVAEVVADLESAPVELLVNNAGFGTSGAFASLDAERLADEIRLNVGALTALTRAVLPGMIAARRGWILNVSSVASFQPAPGLAVYGATKAYVTSFTESLHEELRGSGVVATALCPGLTRTEFQSVSNTEGFVDRYPGAAWLSADEVAEAGLADVAKGRALSVPGVQYKVASALSNVTPRSIKRRAAGIAMQGRR